MTVLHERIVGRAIEALARGQTLVAAQLAAQVLDSAPDHAKATLVRAVAAAPNDILTGRSLAARACRADPDDAEAWFNLGNLEQDLGRRSQAIAAYRKAVALAPFHDGAIANATTLLRVTEHFEEALTLARRHQLMHPHDWMPLAHEAICLAHLDQFEAADEVFARARETSTNPAWLHWEQHFTLLARQRFGEAWDAYERRFECGEAVGVDDTPWALPRWTPESGRKQHVLLYGEQGLGDQLMFASALADLEKMAGRVSIAVSPPLAALFTASFPRCHVLVLGDGRDPGQRNEVLEAAGAEQPIDACLPLGSLLALYRRTRKSFPGKAYLRPSDEARARWAEPGTRRARGARDPLRIGLCWATNPARERFFSHRRALHKTMPIETMLQLREFGLFLPVSLSNLPISSFTGDGETPDGVLDYSERLVDLNETAALIETLDLVITVDTSVAHLAGAMGRKVWLLLHHAGDARWGMPGTSTSYWYPDVELFWQNEPGNWRELIQRVGKRLRQVAGTRS